MNIGTVKIANSLSFSRFTVFSALTVQIKDLTRNNRRRLTIAQFYCPTFPILFSRVSGQKVVVGLSSLLAGVTLHIWSNRYPASGQRLSADSRGGETWPVAAPSQGTPGLDKYCLTDINHSSLYKGQDCRHWRQYPDKMLFRK